MNNSATQSFKAKAISTLVDGEMTKIAPATVWQKHPDAIIIVNKDAASLLK